MRRTLKTSTVSVTPKLAEQWLKANPSNRPINDNTVERYTQQIKLGNWQLTGEPIQFDKDGRLLNGQHRLRAIIKAGKSIDTLVVRGVSPLAVEYMDTGRKRDVKDTMVFAGIDHAGFALASAASWAHQLTVNPRYTHHVPATNHEVVAFYRSAKGFYESMKFGQLAATVVRSAAMAAGLHYLFHQKDTDLADYFFLALGEGTGLTNDNVIYHLRERLLKNAMSKAKLHRKDVAAMIIKTWNLLRAGKSNAPRQSIAWTAKGPSAEDFPLIK